MSYYFYLLSNNLQYPVTVVNLFSLPDLTLLTQSSQTVYLCNALEGEEAIRVIPVTSIRSVVSMFPNLKVTSEGELVDTQKFALLWHLLIEFAKHNAEGLFDEEDNDEMIQFE